MDKKIIMHIDANSAYLSWSAVHALQHGSPVDFRDIPEIVGGNQATRHGICFIFTESKVVMGDWGYPQQVFLN